MSLRTPKVLIVGAGAMGGLFGGLLAERGLDVTLLDTWRDHIDAIRARGLRIVGYGGDRSLPVKATTEAGEVETADLVFFQCKSFSNELAARSVRHLFGGAAVAITFQNGLGNEAALAEVLGKENVLAGLTAQAGLVEAPGVVRNFGNLPTYVGEPAGGLSERTSAIAEVLTRHGLPTSASPDIMREKWKKLLGNVGLGALSAATDLTSAGIMAIPELRRVVLRAVDEAAAVARACGIDLSPQETREVLEKLTSSSGGGTGASKSSMAADVAHRRKTEIDTIHGAVARLGLVRGVATPTIDVMVAVVKGLESQYMAARSG